MTASSHHLLSTSPRNGLLGQVHRYLNTLGSWSSYRDLSRPEDIPQRLADLTTAFFGVEGHNGRPGVASILGAIMAVHALEQATASLVTFGTRLLVWGEPAGHYRGVVLRRSPLTPRAAGALRWLIGSRLLKADGLYFFESGRTWHSQSLTVQLWQASRSLTHLRSLSLPYREMYFDREVAPQILIDLVKGDRAPETIPGFIGSVNELENITSLGYLKRAFFAAHWLLIEPGERDDGNPGYADYGSLINGKPPGGGGGYSQPMSPWSGSGGSPPPRFSGGGQAWPSTTYQAPPSGSSGIPLSRNGPVRPVHEPVTTGAPPSDDPYLRIKERYQSPEGRHYPLLIRGLVVNPITRIKKADAIYYDGDARRWREIVEDEVRVALAQEVEAGRLKVTTNWQYYL